MSQRRSQPHSSTDSTSTPPAPDVSRRQDSTVASTGDTGTHEDATTVLDQFDDSHCRRIEQEDGATLLLVGVVHDHPASVARVRAILRATTPDTLALELPDGSLPLHRQFAADLGEETGVPRGGEMSAAIAAAPDAAVVGIDPLDARFLVGLASELLGERHPPATAWATAKRTAGIARRILDQRLVAAGVREESCLHESETYDCADASSEEQAAHEADHVARCALLRSVTERPPVVSVVTEARECRMVQRLRRLDGDLVVAVVGWDHLDPLAERLDPSVQSTA